MSGPKNSVHILDPIGRGEWIRTTDPLLPKPTATDRNPRKPTTCGEFFVQANWLYRFVWKFTDTLTAPKLYCHLLQSYGAKQ